MKKIGVFGGSFDPVHNAHIAIARAFADQLGLDNVKIIPAATAPHKRNGSMASDAERFEMLKLACSVDSRLVPDPSEIEKGGISYTVNTLEQIKKECPDSEIYFLLGSDSLNSFHKWYMPERILELSNIVVIKRYNDDMQSITENFVERFKKQPVVLCGAGENISSTYVRELLKLGIYENNLINKDVADYIFKHGLYKGNCLYEYMKTHSKPSRLYHTAGVISLALDYASRLGVDKEKVATAALLHDCAKYAKSEDYPLFKAESDVPQPVLHQFLGTYIAEHELGITDSEILGAIMWHTTGKPCMNTIEKIIYTADLLEPSRTYADAEILRKAVDENFEEGFRLCVKMLYEYLKKSSDSLYMSDKTYEYYIKNTGSEENGV